MANIRAQFLNSSVVKVRLFSFIHSVNWVNICRRSAIGKRTIFTPLLLCVSCLRLSPETYFVVLTSEGTSLVDQWLRLSAPNAGVWVRSLVRE